MFNAYETYHGVRFPMNQTALQEFARPRLSSLTLALERFSSANLLDIQYIDWAI